MPSPRHADENLFAAAFRVSPAPMTVSTVAEGRFVAANDAFLAMMGCTLTEVVGRRWTDLGTYSVPGEREHLVQAALTAGSARQVHITVRTRGGEQRDVLVSAEPIEHDGVPCLLAIGEDVTERRRAEEERQALLQQARDSEERLRLALSAGGLGTYDRDPVTGAAFTDARCLELLGLPPDRQDLTYAGFLACVHPEDRALVDGAVDALPRAGKIEHEFRVVHPDGTVRWLTSSKIVHRDPDGRPVRVVGAVRDVTARKEADAQRETLARSEKLRLLGQMASGVAHDLNQSLALIAGYSELAGRALQQHPPDLAGAGEHLAVVGRAARDGGQAVRRLLTFAKPAQGGASRLDLTELLREVGRLTAPEWRDAAEREGRPIRLTIEAPEACPVRGDAAALRQALTNLVMNAVDAMPRGGDIRLSARPCADEIEVVVADTGVGMPPEVRARAFEPFFTTKGERGTGLGLAQVFGIVEAHGGRLALESSPGCGTEFRLTLPVLVEDEAAAAAPAVVGTAPLRLLVVDDEPRLTRMAAMMLRPEGHAVETAASGEEALERLAAEPFDALVTDLGMGAGINGWELAARTHERWPAVAIVLATGWGAQVDQWEARSRGIGAVVAKPYESKDLLGAIAQAREARGERLAGAA